jgi:hypothetical protein
MWSIHELLLFSGSEYLTPRPAWLLRARPNPWDAALAMDGNPATRWRSWWPLYRGMTFQIDFPEPLRLRLEVRDPSGRWSPLEARLNKTEQEAPRDQMPRLATSEVKRRGVDYLLTDLGGQGLNLIGPRIAKNPAAWGLKEVAAYGPIRLYEIE